MRILKLTNIEFAYSNKKENTLNISSFELAQAEKVFLFGPSGYGKTTFLELLAGVLIPQKGEYRFLDYFMSDLSDRARDAVRAAHIGYIFQSFNLIPYLNVRDNILLPLYLSSIKRSKLSTSDENNHVMDLCSYLGIEKYLESKVIELSVGQQQRVAMARAFIGQPELILADEPTSALDQNYREKFIELLFKVCEKNKTSVLFVSHDQTLKNQFDRTVSFIELNSQERL